MSVKFLFTSLLATLFIYTGLIFGYVTEVDGNFNIYYVSLTHLLIYYSILLIYFRRELMQEHYFKYSLLFIGLLYVGIFNYLYYSHTGTFFEFTGSDSTTYHKYALISLEQGYFKGLSNFIFFSKYGFDDAGMVAYLSLLYQIIESPLFPRIINVFLNLFTTILIYRIAREYVAKHRAVVTSLIYGMASYTLYYASSGLKETIFIFILVWTFYSYFLFNNRKNVWFLIQTIVLAVLLLFFRVPVAIFALTSIGFTEFIKRGLSFRKIFPLIMVFGALLALLILNLNEFIHYLFLRNPIVYEASANGGQSMFVQAVSIFSAIFGPLPTFIPVPGSEADTIWSVSLVLKAFLSIYFVYSIYFAFKRKNYTLIAMVVICLLHIIGLIIVIRAFKLRYVIPYLPFFFILSAYAYETVRIYRFDTLKKFVLPVNAVVFLMMLFWNILRI